MVAKKMLRELTKLMAAHYVEKGYMYSGSAHPEGIARSLGIPDRDALYDLISAALSLAAPPVCHVVAPRAYSPRDHRMAVGNKGRRTA